MGSVRAVLPANGQLRFGIHSGQQYADFPSYLELWQFAEDVGLDWASVFDHFMPIMADPTGPCFEGMTLLAAMAAHTSRLRCGMIVTGVTYRHPAVLANMAVTIDHVSGGRLELGIGAAWFELEHQQYGIEFPPLKTRMDMLEEEAKVLRLLWTEEHASFEGQHYHLTEAMCEPKPLQRPSIPLWVGGSGERRTLRTVAQSADGWNTFLMPTEDYDRKLAALAGHCADAGRDPEEIRRQIVFAALLRDSEAEAEEALRELAERMHADPDQVRARFVLGTPEVLVNRLEPFLARGVGDFLLMSRPPGDRRTIELVATEVAPALRSQAPAAA